MLCIWIIIKKAPRWLEGSLLILDKPLAEAHAFLQEFPATFWERNGDTTPYRYFIMTHLLWRIYYWIIAYPTKVEEYLAYCNKAIQTNWRNVMWRICNDAFLCRIHCDAFIVTHLLSNNKYAFKSWGAFDRLELGSAKLIVKHFKTSWVIKLPKN